MLESVARAVESDLEIEAGPSFAAASGVSSALGTAIADGRPILRKRKDIVDDPALWHRLQFAFTITYHYLFPQLTMGLAWFLVYWKWRALRTGDERYAAAARFWARIFGLNFAVGVVTGIPMEFQFGTNWAQLLEVLGRRHRADARDGRDVRLPARERLRRRARLGRAAARATEAFRRRGGAWRWAAGSRATSSS